MREWARRYAQHGFITIVPDFFWRTIPGPLRPEVPEERAQATERNQQFDREAGLADIAAVRDYALALPEANGQWGVARLLFRRTLRDDRGARRSMPMRVVAFHPSKLQLELEAAAAVACPLSFHLRRRPTNRFRWRRWSRCKRRLPITRAPKRTSIRESRTASR